MITGKFKIPFLGKWVYLEPLGDLHVGNANFCENKLKERVKVIKEDKNRYWIGMGDYIDGIVSTAYHSDRRYDFREVDKRFTTVEDQYQYVLDIFKPIANKCIGLLEGNHDRTVSKMSSFDIVKRLAKDLKVRYLMGSALINLHFVKDKKLIWDVPLYATHGSYNGKTIGGDINKLEAMANSIYALVYLVGHSHKIWSIKDVRLKVINGHLVEEYPIFAGTGSFLKGYMQGKYNYAETYMFRPNKVGTVTLIFDPNERRVYYIG